MVKTVVLRLTPYDAAHLENIKVFAAKELKCNLNELNIEILSKSIDARSKNIKIELRLNAYINEEIKHNKFWENKYQDVSTKPEIVIIGAGPAGLFAALRLIELNFKPIIIERGKNVRDRRKDIAAINRNIEVNPDSNYCFGEGGAGTFSDGKLYTRSKKRGNIKRVLEILEAHGADKNILVDTHPHIGTNKLPRIIVSIRETIEKAGGIFLFNSKLTGFKITDNKLTAVQINNNELLKTNALILATGHSANDIYYLLQNSGIKLESKPFAMGVRIEHPQALIDSIQYHCKARSEYLPAASYALVQQVEGRGVYSFCMCPGGFIVPSATKTDEIVVNGMSPSSRNSKFANSGMVAEIKTEDLIKYQKHGELAGLAFRQELEHTAFLNGGGGQVAPAQGVTDFFNGKLSNSLPETSYQPGVVSSPLHFWLPERISSGLHHALKAFNRKMKGYLTNEAIMVGVESRTSSPVRIPRKPETLEHVQISGFYPAGEGAGYAGGIISSAIDGERCAEQVVKKYSRLLH